jgi:hypothetical protein
MKRITLIFFFISITQGAAIAQNQDVVKEFWPEIDIWLRLSKDWRFSTFIPLSRNIETAYREGSLVLQVDYAFGRTNRPIIRRMLDENRMMAMKSMLIRGGYLSARSLGDSGEAYSENMAFAEFHLRTPLKGHFLLSHRVRPESRWIGDENEVSGRFRYRFMAEREILIKSVSLVPYVNAEVYYDTRFDTFNRLRLIGGTSVALSHRFALEGNFTYQYDSRSTVNELYALNMILHIFFETKESKLKSTINR